MLLIEADGKALFRDAGIRVPAGALVTDAEARPRWSEGGRSVVKAQVPVGGRGKSGGVALCDSPGEVAPALAGMLGRTIRGHRVRACLVEQAVSGQETYLSLMVNPDRGTIRLTFAPQGGVEIEASAAEDGALLVDDQATDLAGVRAAVGRMAERVPAGMRHAFVDTAERLADLFFARELLLAEINPLFVQDGVAVAGDAKVVVDGNALDRQTALTELIRARPTIYPDILRKLDEGFDYIELDPEGSIGLVTTGAGLSMMLVDELVGRGCRPINFLDIRTGQFRGSPARLVRVLEWLSDRASLRVLFVNVFAGITDLSEFASLLVQALAASPGLDVPVVARLVGSGEAAARELLARERPDIAVFAEMEPALARVAELAGP